MKIRAYSILLILGLGYVTAKGSQSDGKSPKERLYKAVTDKNQAQVEQIINEQTTEEAKKKLLDSYMAGDTLFSIAIKYDDISMVQLLVKLGADFQKKQTSNKKTPLEFAQYQKDTGQCDNNGCKNIKKIISYLTKQETGGLDWWIYVALAAGILLVIAIVVGVVCLKKKSRPTDDKTELDTVPVHWISEGGRGSRHDSVNSLYVDHHTTTPGIAQQRTSVHNSVNSLYADHHTATPGIAQQRTSVHNSVNSLYAETNGTAQRRNSAHSSENSLYGATNGTAQRRNSAHNSENSLYGATNGNAQQHPTAYDTESGLYATID